MSKYTKEFKLQVAQDHELLKLGYKALSKKYDVPRGLLRYWIYGYQYHGVACFEKRSPIYSVKFKLTVLQHMKEQQMPVMRAAAFFGVAAQTSVAQWQKLYNMGGEAALNRSLRRRTKMTKPKPKVDQPAQEMTQEELLEEVLNLRAERDYLKKLQALIQDKKLAEKSKPH